MHPKDFLLNLYHAFAYLCVCLLRLGHALESVNSTKIIHSSAQVVYLYFTLNMIIIKSFNPKWIKFCLKSRQSILKFQFYRLKKLRYNYLFSSNEAFEMISNASSISVQTLVLICHVEMRRCQSKCNLEYRRPLVFMALKYGLSLYNETHLKINT